MALPTTKQELADWILRRLGAPVVNVEVTDEAEVIEEVEEVTAEVLEEEAELISPMASSTGEFV